MPPEGIDFSLKAVGQKIAWLEQQKALKRNV